MALVETGASRGAGGVTLGWGEAIAVAATMGMVTAAAFWPQAAALPAPFVALVGLALFGGLGFSVLRRNRAERLWREQAARNRAHVARIEREAAARGARS